MRPSIGVAGIKDLRRDLRTLDKALPRELNRELRQAVQPIAREGAVLAPHRSGRLAASLRPYAAGAAVGVRTRLPYAGAIHWGGRVGPGKRSLIPRSTHTLADGSQLQAYRPFIWQAAARNKEQLIRRVSDVTDRTARRHGWQ